MSDVGGRVKQVRLERDWSVTDLAKKARLAQSTVSELENGDSRSTKAIVRIALALGVSPHWLDTGRGPKKLRDLEAAIMEWSEDEFNAALAFIEAMRARRGGK